MAKKAVSATRAAENEIFDLLKFSEAQRDEARDAIDFIKTDVFVQNPKVGFPHEESHDMQLSPDEIMRRNPNVMID